jgi:Ricin-type beta-trefoil lectin domain
MMRGIRRLVVYAAATGLLAAGAVSASLEVAHADNFAAACGGNAANEYICNLDAVIVSPGSITVSVDSGAASENLNVNWTVTCANGSSSQSELGATDNAATPLSVPLAPLPSTAAGGSCNVNAGITVPAHDITPKVAYTGTLTYTPAGSSSGTTSSAVHPIVGFGGKCVDDKGNSSANRTKIEIWGCSSSDQAENWKFSGGELIHNGKCANDKGNGGSGSPVILYSCNGGSNEKWTSLANGELRLQAHGGTLCLDDPRSSTTNGTGLIVYKCNDNANQRWSLP